MKMFKKLLALCVSSLLFVSCAGGNSAKNKSATENKSSKTISVYNWGDYIDETLLDEFEKQTGIKVIYETFATNEDMYTKIKNGGASYDIAIPSDYMIEKMAKENLLEKIDKTKIPNYKNIHERFYNLPYDKNDEYSVPYMWGTVGILYNKMMVTDPVDSFSLLWNEKYKGQIFMYDSMRDSLGVALKYLGYSLNTTNLDELNKAKELLVNQKPIVQAYVGDAVKDKMIGNEGALAVVYSGDAIYCMEQNEDLAYSVPKEGSNLWVDAVVIPKGATNIDGAHAFINFLCDPDVALKNTEYIGYSTVNKLAYEKMPEELKNDPTYWPSDEVYKKCEVYVDLGETIKEYDKIWTEIFVN